MGKSLAYKILEKHIISGKIGPGEEIGIRIDQTLTQDATGTMAYLQFEALGLPHVQTKRSVSYVDHNTLQTGFENADDHRFLQSVAAKYGIYFSRPGNGICHQVHLERFGVPGMTLLGSDSHTPTGGGLGMIAIGAGGLDVAVAMGGGPFYLPTPRVINVFLTGKLQPWVSAKDVILEVLRRLSVKGGVGAIIEYSGPGVKTLSVPERATITNMGAELGATTSIFPSDEITRKFLASQKRSRVWKPLSADRDARYDKVVKIDLTKIVPLVAQPHSPDNVVAVKKLRSLKVNQVLVGSCTNSSYRDLMTAARMLKGRTVHPDVSLGISPGSKQVLQNITRDGGLEHIIMAGARLLECACGPCIGMGQSPCSDGVSARTFNRNFLGRSGTKSAGIYLCSVETAIATALTGKMTDPRTLGKVPAVRASKAVAIDDSMIVTPPKDGAKVEIIRGPNIRPLPLNKAFPDELTMEVLLKVGDNITTDHIMPAGSKILPLRSNIPAISEYVFSVVDPDFSIRAREKKGGFVVGGENYGQGSSREHAALAPMYLGLKAVITRSFARIHHANLVNFGILPLVFDNPSDLDKISQGDVLTLKNIRKTLKTSGKLHVENVRKKQNYSVSYNLSPRQVEVVLAGGLLNYTRKQKA